MNPDEKLALLEPHGVRMDGGRGGKPELTWEDVTLALGMIPDDLKAHASVYLAIHHPTCQTLHEADELVKDAQLRECLRRTKRIVIARMEVQVKKDEVEGSHGGIHGVRRALAEARANLETVMADKWPRYDTRYQQVRVAVLGELHAQDRCKQCAGRSTVRINGVDRNCPNCHGTGKKAHSDQMRADAIGLSRQTYKHAWEGLYVWTLELCDLAASAARQAFERALGRTD